MDRQDLEAAARAAAASAGIPANVVFGIIQTESAWNPNARSGAGAVGLMQIMPWWVGKMGFTDQILTDPVQNLTAGVRIFADELDRFGSVELAAMAYNAGATAVTNAIRKAGGSRDPETVSQYLPASETRAYWKKVITWAQHYAGDLGEAAATVEAAATDVTETVKGSPVITALVILFIAAAAMRLK